MEVRPQQEPPAHAVRYPLLRRQWLRALVAGTMVSGHLAIVGLAYILLVWLFEPAKFGFALGLLVPAAVVAWVVVVGRWTRGVGGAIQVAAAVTLCLLYVGVAVVAVAAGLDDLSSRSTYGTPADDAGIMFAIAALAAIALAILATALPLSVGGRVATIAALAAALAGVGGLGTAGAVTVGADSCEDFRLDRGRWEAALRRDESPGQVSDAQRLASAIVRCRTVKGASRAQVRRLLGRAHQEGGRWSWFVGETNDAMGPGDAQDLYVKFGSDGRARNAYLP